MKIASMAHRKPSSEPNPQVVDGDKVPISVEEKPTAQGTWVTVCKYIVMFNGAMAGAKALWDNVNLIAGQTPRMSQLVLDTAFFAGALTVYVFAAFLPLGFIVTSLVDSSELGDKVKHAIFTVVIVGCLSWGGYKTFFNHDAPLVPYYTRIIGAVVMAAVAGVIYQEISARREKSV